MDCNDYQLEKGTVLICACLLRNSKQDWVIEATAQAEHFIGQDYAMNEAAQQERQKLVQMVKLNLTNRREYSRERLNRKFAMAIPKDVLTTEKHRFCYEFARLCRLI